jgi:hypothetical protein
MVIDEAGQPVANKTVMLADSAASRTASTDAQGRFRFEDIMPGEQLSVRINHEGEIGPQQRVPAGTDGVVLIYIPAAKP